jgi:GMP synthase (glutamine-hydrolysing)
MNRQPFHVGLLQCDSVRDELRPVHGDYPDMFLHRLHPWIESGDLTVSIFNLPAGNYPHSPDQCHGWITTGSRQSVHDSDPWIHWLADFIRSLHQSGPPCVGICFGHQMIAHAMGGSVAVSSKGWGIGLSKNAILQHQPWMNPPSPSLHLLVSHMEQVQTLPHHSTHLASSDFCPHYAFTCGPFLLGIQGHPEFEREYSRDLNATRKSIIPEQTLHQAEASLQFPHQGDLAFQWIVQFLTSRRNASGINCLGISNPESSDSNPQ